MTSDPRVVLFGDGRRFHRDRGDKTAACNVGNVGRIGFTRKTSWAMFAGYERCRRCWAVGGLQYQNQNGERE